MLARLRKYRVPYVVLGIALGIIGIILLIHAVSFALTVAGVYDAPLSDAALDAEFSHESDLAKTIAQRTGAAQSATMAVTPQGQPDSKLSNALMRAGSIPTRITIPSIRVDSPVVPIGWQVRYVKGQLVSEWEVADSAVGFHRDSAAPGQPGNTVLSGHNNTKGEVFRNLSRIKVGDVISLYVDNREYRYVATQKVLLNEYGATAEKKEQNLQWIQRTSDERLTLVSCYPYSTNSKRLVVVAVRE